MATLTRRTINSPLTNGLTNTAYYGGGIAVNPIVQDVWSAPPAIGAGIAAYSTNSQGYTDVYNSYKKTTALNYNSLDTLLYERSKAFVQTGRDSYMWDGSSTSRHRQSVFDAPSLMAWDGPFLSTRVNMLGQTESLSRTDPRHTASAYENRYPQFYSQYTSGAIGGQSLFNQSLAYSVRNDRDEINSSIFNYSAPPVIRFSFNSRGGGSITGTGISFH